jgi:hypothetical protein
MWDPAQEATEADELEGSKLECHPPAHAGVNLDGLESIQQTDSAQGNSGAQSVIIKDKFASNITQKVFHPES